jgi:hypothetical protein
MNSNRKAAIVAGSLFLIAMAASLIGGGLLETILSVPDYLSKLYADSNQVWTGMSLELINAIAVVGIAAALFPVLKPYNESMATGYVGFRIIESFCCIIAVIVPLLLVPLSQKYTGANMSDNSVIQTLSTVLMNVRIQMAGLLIPVFFSLGALLLYSVLYTSKLLPRFIPVWGLIGVLSITALNLFEFDTHIKMMLALPIILNEIFMGIWLIAKGFNQSGKISY